MHQHQIRASAYLVTAFGCHSFGDPSVTCIWGFTGYHLLGEENCFIEHPTSESLVWWHSFSAASCPFSDHQSYLPRAYLAGLQSLHTGSYIGPRACGIFCIFRWYDHWSWDISVILACAGLFPFTLFMRHKHSVWMNGYFADMDVPISLLVMLLIHMLGIIWIYSY